MLLALVGTFVCSNAKAQTSGLKADLRSSAEVLTNPVGGVPPTAPAGAVSVGQQTWVCDATEGLAPVIAAGSFLAIGAQGNIKLPISATTTPATCGQTALGNDGFAYVTQAVVDTRNTPSTARGILRVPLQAGADLPQGLATYIATTAGLDGNQPTAAAIGPDGNLYVGFLKNGNVKRIVNPESGTTQVVQSVGNTPQGYPARAFAFVGADLYIASAEAFSVIKNATSPSCTGGCNAVALGDGFSGIAHPGLTSDGTGTVYFSVAAPFAGGNQVWRYKPTPSSIGAANDFTGNYTFVSAGGVDPNGASASNFAFNAAKTNLLALDPSGTLWIGDDPSGVGAAGAGRLWTIGAALSGLPAGSAIAGTNLQQILNVLHGPWQIETINSLVVVTFNADGTFTAVITPFFNGVIMGPNSATSGTWTLAPPAVPQQQGNPQGQLTLIDNAGTVLISGVYLLANDSLITFGPTSGSFIAGVAPFVKLAP